jgi:hypothetical protein
MGIISVYGMCRQPRENSKNSRIQKIILSQYLIGALKMRGRTHCQIFCQGSTASCHDRKSPSEFKCTIRVFLPNMAKLRKRKRSFINNTPPSSPAKRPCMPPKGKQRQTAADVFKISWSDPSRTSRLIDWLDQYPRERHMLFSDSAQDASAEGRRQDVGKTQKSTYHAMIAQYVFINDQNPDYVRLYHEHPAKFTKSVADRITTYVLPVHSFLFALMLSITVSRRNIVKKLHCFARLVLA